jgi:hypothetical protein
MSRRRENSVRNLQFLYSVFVVLALESIISLFIKNYQFVRPEHWYTVPLVFAFLFTVIPFYHGALRHLDDSYVEGGQLELKSYALLIDFIVLFLESALIYALANMIELPREFAIILVTLLATDAGWGALIRPRFMVQRQERPEMTWAKINAVTIGWLAAVLLAYFFLIDSPAALALLVLVTCAVRTVIDYWTSWSFYFPD